MCLIRQKKTCEFSTIKSCCAVPKCQTTNAKLVKKKKQYKIGLNVAISVGGFSVHLQKQHFYGDSLAATVAVTTCHLITVFFSVVVAVANFGVWAKVYSYIYIGCTKVRQIFIHIHWRNDAIICTKAQFLKISKRYMLFDGSK